MTSFHSMQRLLAALLSGILLALPAGHAVRAAVPNEDAVPAYAEEQTILQAEKDTPEPGWFDAASGRVHLDRHYLGQYGSTEGTVIVQRGGNTWRVLRNGPFAAIAGTLFILVPLLIFGFYGMVGPARVERESGNRIERFSAWQRLVHWSTAIAFIAMAITGVIVLFGKTVLMPWMGHDAYAGVAIVAKYLHNFVGPLFILCSIVMFFTFLRENLFRRWDWQWIKKGGGLVSHEHVPAGYFNAGEKLWFWGGVSLLGLIVSISGLALDFVVWGQTRYILQWANYLHLAAATLYIVFAMGHIYIGTLGTPGAYHAMRHGTVDEEWARAHHQLWYERLRGDGRPGDFPPQGAAPRGGRY